MPNKRISLSIYSLPKTFYVKYNILVLFLIVFANALTIFFVWDIQHKFFEVLHRKRSSNFRMRF